MKSEIPVLMDGAERFGSAAAAAVCLQLRGENATAAGVQRCLAGKQETHCGHTFERAGAARGAR